jgi:hypothetical protein
MDLNTLVTNLNNDENIEISEEKDFVMKKNYDHNKKMELVKKINKIKKKEYLLNIFKIILLHSKDYTENNNGVFIFFHNLTDEAYDKIESYVNKIYKMHKKSSSSNIFNIYNSELSDSQQNILSDTIEIDNDKNLSNKEKLIMRRKKYEKYLDQNQEK